MRYLLNGLQMKEADSYTIREKGVSSLELMERAADSFMEAMEENKVDLSDACIVCGSGNNGGDGFAIARRILERGMTPMVIFAGEEEHLTPEAKKQLASYEEEGGGFGNTCAVREYSVVIDALFGAGLNRPAEGMYETILDSMNACGGVKAAVDVPSGISASTGEALGTAFKADVTVSFQNEKLGTALYPGREYAGKVIVKDIGVDIANQKADKGTAVTLEEKDIPRLMPKRVPDSHKGTYGKALIIAGSRGMAGAAYLSALAAYKVGAGLVQIYTAEDNREILQTLLPEAIIKCYDFFDERELIQLLKWADVVSIGSGLGTSDKSRRVLRTTLEYAEIPCVVDADGLNLLSEHMRYLKDLPHDRFVFTPHMKEMSRITRKSIPELKKEKMEILKEFTAEYPVTCVLKDARTYVCKGGEHPIVNLSGNAAMAKAGSGDVLAGIITGLIAQGMDCFEAAALGVYIHGLAGDKAKELYGSYGVLARNLAEEAGSVLKGQEE